MNFDLRGAVIANIAGNSQNELEATIVDAIQSGEEKLLPGLGVLFEIIWQHADGNEKKEMLEALQNGLQSK